MIKLEYAFLSPEWRALLPAGVQHGIAVMSQPEFKALYEYSTSLPTGTTTGKQWKARFPASNCWFMGEFYDLHDDSGEVGIRWYVIVTVLASG